MKPEKIYKYQSVNNNSLASLKNNQIWFSNVEKFNDPFEITIMFDEEPFDKNEIDRILNRNGIQDYNLLDEEILHAKESIKKTIIEETINIRNSKGVACFSENYDDILMWSHYGDCHKGFCLEFSTNKEPFNKIKMVRYSDSRPKVPLKLDEISGKYFDCLFTKSKHWEYEKEWRLLHNECDKFYGYDNECLTGIYFGAKMEYAYKEIICLILQGQNQTVKFYDGCLDDKKYKVNFKNVEYISYLKRKEEVL